MTKRKVDKWYRRGDRWRRRWFNRKYKDVLFRRLFREKKDLLELYNALNGSTYEDPEELEVVTMEDVIFMKMKNDLSFIIASHLNLYEHQSTWNPNMPLRGLLYFAQQFEGLVSARGDDIYGKGRIELPTPEYIVFYNGSGMHTDDRTLYLSDSYSAGHGSGCLECICKVVNINRGYNRELMEKCHRLWEYSELSAEIEGNMEKGMGREEAVEAAIDDCIERGILADILLAERGVVMHMLLTHYDEKRHLKNTFEEGRKEGLEEGIEKGIKKGLEKGMEKGLEEGIEKGREEKLCEQVRKKLSKGRTVSEIAEELEEEESVIEQIINGIATIDMTIRV